jgi:hypothetical protein
MSDWGLNGALNGDAGKVNHLFLGNNKEMQRVSLNCRVLTLFVFTFEKLTDKKLTAIMMKQNRGFTALSSMLYLKKNELLEMLRISRPHAHMIDRSKRSMPSEAALISSSLQLALAKSGSLDQLTAGDAPIARKDVHVRLQALKLKISTLSRKVERLAEADQHRLKALAAFKIWEIDPMLSKSRRERLSMWKKFHIRRLETTGFTTELADAQARLAGLKAEEEFWRNQ